MSSLPALQSGILIPFKLLSPLVSFHFAISYDSNVVGLRTLSEHYQFCVLNHSSCIFMSLYLLVNLLFISLIQTLEICPDLFSCVSEHTAIQEHVDTVNL